MGCERWSIRRRTARPRIPAATVGTIVTVHGISGSLTAKNSW